MSNTSLNCRLNLCIDYVFVLRFRIVLSYLDGIVIPTACGVLMARLHDMAVLGAIYFSTFLLKSIL